MVFADYLVAGAVAVGMGIDRTAALQLMVSRPIVAAPLTGWLLGDPIVGLQVGFLVELLWIGRLPVGAAIPPDDTQVAVGGTLLAVTVGKALALVGMPFTVLCVLVAMPLGKFGQTFDRGARHLNGRLLSRAEAALAGGDLNAVERSHLIGLGHFALSSLGTYVVIVTAGSLVLFSLAPYLHEPLVGAADWVKLAFPLVGVGAILGTINVSRAMTLFGASFVTALLMLWLV
ncbi:MAG: hypothetical protein C0617_02455 [Desulfuromonas sp.]|uniref:PTS sugar transporter subunit IIC n=1 Tax=Desulfuromonas sp. TaxID=892 RepID=UPI000CB4B0EB|nr:PTS sugar transporter subunit IIC [Desulfuromonas sp.]PLX86020.1 MAG: hypothetical protein C0617_02455 [Desulfuromonas sp.]